MEVHDSPQPLQGRVLETQGLVARNKQERAPSNTRHALSTKQYNIYGEQVVKARETEHLCAGYYMDIKQEAIEAAKLTSHVHHNVPQNQPSTDDKCTDSLFEAIACAASGEQVKC